MDTDDICQRNNYVVPGDDELDQLIQTNTCGIDPKLDSMSPHDQWTHEVAENGICGVKYGSMYSRLCKDCNLWGRGYCKPLIRVKRSGILLKTAGVQGDCPICYAPMKNKKLVQTKCGHKFHADCLIRWAQKSWPTESCPICRTELERFWAFLDIKDEDTNGTTDEF